MLVIQCGEARVSRTFLFRPADCNLMCHRAHTASLCFTGSGPGNGTNGIFAAANTPGWGKLGKLRGQVREGNLRWGFDSSGDFVNKQKSEGKNIDPWSRVLLSHGTIGRTLSLGSGRDGKPQEIWRYQI